MVYQTKIDLEEQALYIEDEYGQKIASRQLPIQKLPNPGQEALLKYPDNMRALNRILKLVTLANIGAKREG